VSKKKKKVTDIEKYFRKKFLAGESLGLNLSLPYKVKSSEILWSVLPKLQESTPHIDPAVESPWMAQQHLVTT
jgi:hypothetical protein